MNKINRSLVKSQARYMLKGKFFYLFIITFIVLLLTGSFSSIVTINSTSLSDEINDHYNSGDYYGYNRDDNGGNYNDNGNYGNFGYDSDNPIENFNFQSYSEEVSPEQVDFDPGDISRGITFSSGNFSTIIGIVFTPLMVTLAAVYLRFVRRNPDEVFHISDELGYLFKHTFDNTYGKKLVLGLLRSIIIIALSLLLIFPGVIYYYRTYFSYQLLDEYPDLKPSEAVKLSAKITDGNKSELFVLDLSFIGWYLLGIITLGIGMIYVLPYYMTTQALYYENFRLRAIDTHRVTEDDFLSEKQRFEKYNQPNYGFGGNNGYNQNNQYSQYNYNPYNQNTTGSQNTNVYYTPNNETQPHQVQTDYSYKPEPNGSSGEYKQDNGAENHVPDNAENVVNQDSVNPGENSKEENAEQSVENVVSDDNPFVTPPENNDGQSDNNQ